MSIDPMIFPEPPTREDWGFLKDLRKREVRHVHWKGEKAGSSCLDLSKGIRLCNAYPDDGSLATAFDDIAVFAADTGLSISDSGVPLVLSKVNAVSGRESYEMSVSADGVELKAEDTEGMRRAIYYFENQVAAQKGPFLPYGTTVRKPWLRNRISRCFFGPIKRPPFNRDELMDDMDYYPDEYLNRLAHEGINGLWLTVVFREIAETSFTKRDENAPRRLAKLRRTIKQCLRYGIKTWIFAIEPRWIAKDDPILIEHPELGGARTYDGNLAFCPSSPAGKQYLYETMRDIFTQLPGLGGFLNISHGERPTNCLSTIMADTNNEIKCPRCSQRQKWEIHYDTTAAMIKGMKEANPDAEMISWLYQPQPSQVRGEWIFDIARHVPEGVTLQYNFESGAQKKQLSRVRSGGDYWLSFIGPTEIFERMADNARHSGAKLSAKIQVGCSHEVATVPFVSVPGLLYHKYKAMHRCGCSSVMQCWYFGNYPGIMNRAAGELAFEEFKDTEEDFLYRLALPQWGEHAGTVAAAWKHFTEGYSYYPLSNDMQYYGPMHAGITWPMFLYLENKPLGPTWKPDFPPSGDTLGECLENHSLEEAYILTCKMTEHWHKGMKLLDCIEKDFADDTDRQLDIGVSKALDLQFASAKNIFKYYMLRRIFLSVENTAAEKLSALLEMKCILSDEIKNAQKMAVLCEKDSRLGFHSEAEAHQYCTSRLKWRAEQIAELIEGPVMQAENLLVQGKLPDMSRDYSHICERYNMLTDSTMTSGITSWKITTSDDGDFYEIALESKASKATSDAFLLTIMDEFGTSFPWVIRITPDGFADSNNTVEAEIAKAADGWNATIRIPRFFWGNKKASKRFYLYLQHDVSYANQPSYRYTWPVEENPPRARLNLGAFQANHCGLIEA